ncbi:hypothetical protein [Streptomyces sp. NPDC088400]|jgi:hypothetical protein|uniref:hypothetical protein n=1 Tax=Streptomyces sp. NPDC088400 TaxID=3365861 RepID=UPI00380ECA6F
MKKRTWVLGVLALPLAYLGWVAWQVVADLTDDDVTARRQPVSCKEAMRFADQSGVPAGASDAKCEVMGALDTQYDVRFRITRADLDTWLASAYPGMKMTSDCTGSAETVDTCGNLTLDPYADGGAVGIDLTVEYEKGDTALVHFRPFNT